MEVSNLNIKPSAFFFFRAIVCSMIGRRRQASRQTQPRVRSSYLSIKTPLDDSLVCLVLFYIHDCFWYTIDSALNSQRYLQSEENNLL